MKEYSDILSGQKEFFRSGKTRSLEFRLENLKKLYNYLIKNESIINEALWKDLHKGYFESYISETGVCRAEVKLLIRNIHKLMKPKKVSTPLFHFKAKSYIVSEPYGQNLIIGPWNYPVQLIIVPLAGAIAAGNTAIVKPSELSGASEQLIREMIEELFPQDYIACVTGGIKESQELLKLNYDHIFFTGSQNVGRKVMEAAARNLTPVTLELGGKNPVIVDETANIDLAARRITWGKFLNAGQTCVAPDYLFVHESLKSKLIDRISYYIKSFYGENIIDNEDFTRIINKINFKRLKKLISDCKIIYGGEMNESLNFIGPTLVYDPPADSSIMQEEIFGPVLVIISYSELSEVIENIKKRDKALSMYIFSNSQTNRQKLLSSISAGNGAINDTVLQFVNSNLPFGGAGPSGIGSYHGKQSFYTFSHQKSLLEKSNIVDLKMRYPPYSRSKLKMIKSFFG